MLTFVVLNAGAVFVAARVALAAGGGVRASRLALAILSGYLAVIHLSVLVAGLLGWLTVGGLTAVTAIAVAGAWRCAGGRAERLTGGGAARSTPPALFVPLLAIVTGAMWAWPHLAGDTRLWIWDDYTYHMVYPSIWLRERAIAAVAPAQAFTMQAWYPLSAGVVATWFMAPFHGARGESLAWVSLTAPLYGGLVVTAAAEVLARAGGRAFGWALPVVLFASSQRTGVMASSFSDADLAVAAALFGALAFSIPDGAADPGREAGIDAWYAALLTGLALGIKPSAAPAAVIVLVVMLVRARRTRGRLVAAFAVSWLAMAGYWYARNLVHTGNPVYPAAFLVWPGAAFPQTTLREYSHDYGLARTISDALAVYLNWPRYHGTLAIVGLVGLGGGLVTRRGQRWLAAAAVSIAAVTLGLLPVTPYSAGNAMTFVSGFVHWDSMRYVALLPLLGWVGLGFLLDAGRGAPAARTVIAISLAAGAVLAGLPRPAALVALAVAATGAVIAARVRLPSGVMAPAALATAAVLAAILVGSHADKAAATAAAIHHEPLFGAAAAMLDRQPAGTRVAVFGDQWIYPAFGDRDHLVPVRLDGDGRIATAPVGDAMTPGPLTVDAAVFARNLEASRVDVVAVVHLPHPGRSPEWPAQQRALAAAGARLLHRDGAVAIWSTRRGCEQDVLSQEDGLPGLSSREAVGSRSTP
jgi:hypothetical protein